MQDSKYNYVTLSFTLGSSDKDLVYYLERCGNKSFIIKKALREYMECHPFSTEIEKPESVPTEEGLIRSIVKTLYIAKLAKQEHLSLSDLYDLLADAQALSDEEINATSPKTGVNLFQNRVRYSLTLAKKKGYIDNPSRGMYSLTDYGFAIGQFLHSQELLETNDAYTPSDKN